MDEFAADYMHILCLGDFESDCRSLDPAVFAEVHGTGFLIHHGPIGKLHKASQDASTLAHEDPAGGGSSFNPRENFLVFQVRRSPALADADPRIRVGRRDDNDVVIPDASVSGRHAFFHLGADGRYFLQDNESRNGSFINDQAISLSRPENSARLSSGAWVRFGSVELTFLQVPEFIDLVCRLTQA